MELFEHITTRIVALIATIRANPVFAVLVPVPARERLRIPRRVLGHWDRYRHGFPSIEPGSPDVGSYGQARVRARHRGATALLWAVLPILSVADARAADPRMNDGEDVRRQAQIATVYAMNPLLRDSVIVVTVTGSNASLVGKVGSTVEKELAEEIALSIDGIEHVDDLIGVMDVPDLRRARSDPSFGQKIDDATTTAAIRSKLLWGSTTSGLNIQVVTVVGKVRLDGTVYDSAQRDLIGHVAADTVGVFAVTNEIVVLSVPPVTSGAQADARKLVEDMRRPVSDAWITARIQSTFLLSPSMNRSAVSIVTSDGSVSLSGSAGSASARSSAIMLAKNTRGVQSVDSTRLMTN